MTNYPLDLNIYACNNLVEKEFEYPNTKITHADRYSRFGKLLWSQTTLPYWANKDDIDVFWSPIPRTPKFLSKKVVKVITVHDLVWAHEGKTMQPFSRLVNILLSPQAIRKSDLIITISKSTANDICHLYPEAVEKVRVVYPGLTQLPKYASLSNTYFERQYILFVGTLEPRKNLYSLLKAFSIYKKDYKDVILVLAGDNGWGKINVDKWCEDLNLTDRVIRLGYVTDEQLANLYANSLFVALPSLYEGFGYPIIEAMSFGKSVLTSNVSSMPEVGGNAAVFVDPKNVRSIAEGLRVLTDNQTRSMYEARTNENISRFCLRDSVANLWGVLQEAYEMSK